VVEAYRPGQEALRADAQGKLSGVLLDARKDPAEAARLAREALAVRGERAHLLDLLARSCQAAGDAACARDASERLLRRPHLPDATRRRAEDRLASPDPPPAAR
jgi:hypothetical protein